MPDEISPSPEALDTDRREALFAADTVYREMQRVTDISKIRMRMSLRYTLLMFALFLTFLWIVSNRVIMFGFNEFALLARIRDILFCVMAGLFTLTIWHGVSVWFHTSLPRVVLRVFGVLFFCAIVVALYVPAFFGS